MLKVGIEKVCSVVEDREWFSLRWGQRVVFFTLRTESGFLYVKSGDWEGVFSRWGQRVVFFTLRTESGFLYVKSGNWEGVFSCWAQRMVFSTLRTESGFLYVEDREWFSLHTDGAHHTSAFSRSLVLLALLRTWTDGVLFLTERLHYGVSMLRVRLLTKRQLYVDLRVCLLTHKRADLQCWSL